MVEASQVGRLALREEGEMWVAYFAYPDTMVDAIRLGSIRLNAVKEHRDLRQSFIDLMCEIVGDKIEEALGGRPVWGQPTIGPDRERAGNA